MRKDSGPCGNELASNMGYAHAWMTTKSTRAIVNYCVPYQWRQRMSQMARHRMELSE